MTEERVSAELRKLMRGLSHNSIDEALHAYRALFEIGAPALPHIRAALLRANWKGIKYGLEIRYLAQLLTLAHDIDETAGRGIGEAIIGLGCNTTVERCVRNILRFRSDDFRRYHLQGIEVFENIRLKTGFGIASRLQEWLKIVPDKDISNVRRIYVIRDDVDRDYKGQYTPILSKITLVWKNPFTTANPLYWILIRKVERTFYHEIGHHARGHTFGQDPEQEREADAYADRMLKLNHPWLARIAW